jgi:hypothetical protein
MSVEERLARIEALLGNGMSTDIHEIKASLQRLVDQRDRDSERITRLEERQSRTTGILAIAQVIGTALGITLGGRQV